MFQVEISVSSHPLKSDTNDSLIYQSYNRHMLYTIHSANVIENSVMNKAVPSEEPRIWQKNKENTHLTEWWKRKGASWVDHRGI